MQRVYNDAAARAKHEFTDTKIKTDKCEALAVIFNEHKNSKLRFIE